MLRQVPGEGGEPVVIGAEVCYTVRTTVKVRRMILEPKMDWWRTELEIAEPLPTGWSVKFCPSIINGQVLFARLFWFCSLLI